MDIVNCLIKCQGLKSDPLTIHKVKKIMREGDCTAYNIGNISNAALSLQGYIMKWIQYCDGKEFTWESPVQKIG